MLEVADVTVDYGFGPVLRSVSLGVTDKPAVIVGPSGSGKSTLLRVIAGQQRPCTGTVTLDGMEVRPPSWTTGGDQRIGLIHQDYRLITFLSVMENLKFASAVRGIEVSDDVALTELESVGLTSTLARRMPLTLSGGEQQRVAIARTMICKPRLVIADEPTGSLDAENSRRISDVLLGAAERHGAIILVASHDQGVIDRFACQLKLQNGDLAFSSN